MTGNGLNKLWYLRLISLLLTVIIPFAAFFWMLQHDIHFVEKLNSDPFLLIWGVFGWLIYVIIIIIIQRHLENVIRKKNRKRNMVIQTININGEDFNNYFQKESVSSQNTSSDGPKMSLNTICPGCGSHEVALMRSGKYVCLDCDCKFFIEK